MLKIGCVPVSKGKLSNSFDMLDLSKIIIASLVTYLWISFTLNNFYFDFEKSVCYIYSRVFRPVTSVSSFSTINLRQRKKLKSILIFPPSQGKSSFLSLSSPASPHHHCRDMPLPPEKNAEDIY